MLSLTSKSITDYQTCARLYDYRYNDKLYESVGIREMAVDRFEDTMKRVVTFFFYKKQGGNVPSYSALLNRWERLWFPKGTDALDIATEQHSSLYKNNASYTTEASSALLNFYERFAEDEGEPFMVDEKFIVPLNDDIKLSGSFDLVLRYRSQSTFVIFKWFARGKRPAMSHFNTDFAIAKHAFEYKTQAKFSYRKLYGLYDLASVKPGFTLVNVTEEDINALNFWANAIREDEVYPSRRGLTPYCNVCPFDAECKAWNGWLKRQATND